MRIDVDEGTGRDPAELAEIERGGAWFVGFANPDATTVGLMPFVVHGVDGYQTADTLAGALAEKYPDRAVYAVGLARRGGVKQARLVAHVPEDVEWSGPATGETMAMIEVARAHLELYRRRELDRADATAPTAAGRRGDGAMGKPDLSDHLYQNKQAFPDHRRPAGQPAGELAGKDGGRQLDPNADRQALGDVPGGREGGAP